MYLYTRRTRLAPGHGTAGVDWARSVAARAQTLTGREFRLWGSVWSPGAGTIGWTGWFGNLTELEAAGEALDADASLEKLTNAATRYTDRGFEDELVAPIYGAPTTALTRYVDGATAIVAGGDCAEAVAAGVAIAERSEAVTGRPTIFGRALTGRAGVVTWLTGYENAASLEVAQRELAADRAWRELLDSTRRCFADSGRATRIYRRLG